MYKITTRLLKDYIFLDAFINLQNITIKEYEKARFFYTGSMNQQTNSKQIKELDSRIEKSKEDLRQAEKEKKTIEAFINSVSNPVIRKAIKLRYKYGYSWQQVTESVTDGYISEDTLRKEIKRYIDNKK